MEWGRCRLPKCCSLSVEQHAGDTGCTWKRRGTKSRTRKRGKIKRAEDELEELRKKRKTIANVFETLEKDADSMAEKAENTAGTKMAELITKSNTMRKRCKEKRGELADLERELEKKGEELRHIA